jgi:Creatinine amidohydrolase
MRASLTSAFLALALPSLSAQVLDVRELNTEQIRGLDRAKTAVILVGGILEEHGPYLPAYIDGYDNERYARDLAEAIAARPGWAAVLFPTIPLGQGGANMIGGKHSFPGTFNVRNSAAMGAQQYKERSPLLTSLALKVLDGWDPRAEPRYVQTMQGVPGIAEVLQGTDQDEARREARQREWLAKRARP